MRNYRNLTRFLHIALALSGIFALSALGVLLSRANGLVDHATLTVENMDRTVIVAGASLSGIQKAEKGQLDALAATQARLNGILESLQKSVSDTDRNINGNVLPSVTMTVGSLNAEIQDFRRRSGNLMADAHHNLVVLADTQAQLNRSIAALDLPTLGRNVNLMAEQGITISRNAASASGHLDKISADAEYEANKFVAPKTKWGKFKGALGVLWRVAAFAVVKAI